MSDTNEPKYERDKIYTINVSELIPNPQQPRQYFDENEIKALAKSAVSSSKCNTQSLGIGVF